MKKILREFLYKMRFGARLYEYAALFIKPEFVGWGLATIRTTPWSNNKYPSALTKKFNTTHEALQTSIESGEFILLQGRDQNIAPHRMMSSLKWRHYMVYWSIQYVCMQCKNDPINLVELGVFDGLTAFFAASATEHRLGALFLYDSWEAMTENRLQKSESQMIGAYKKNSENIARANLHKWVDKVIFNRGFIPESFASATNPEKCHWLHIDLNSSDATYTALEYFYDKLCAGGIILFDDYGARQFSQTREVVDAFFQGKSGILLPFPTGQAIYFKLSQ